jgi:hypothetical protein
MPAQSFEITNHNAFHQKLREELRDFRADRLSSRHAINFAMTAYHLYEWVLECEPETSAGVVSPGRRDMAQFFESDTPLTLDPEAVIEFIAGMPGTPPCRRRRGGTRSRTQARAAPLSRESYAELAALTQQFVSRVLSLHAVAGAALAIIPLGRASPRASCGLPRGSGGLPSDAPLHGLAPDGVCLGVAPTRRARQLSLPARGGLPQSGAERTRLR